MTEADLGEFHKYHRHDRGDVQIISFISRRKSAEGRAIPGALVYSIAGRTLGAVDHAAYRTCLPQHGADGKGPTFVNDTLHVEVEVMEVRQTSKGTAGWSERGNEVKNQHGETVIVYTPLRMVAGREE